jgi:hypothetical protein
VARPDGAGNAAAEAVIKQKSAGWIRAGVLEETSLMNNSEYGGETRENNPLPRPIGAPAEGLVQRAKRLFGRGSSQGDQAPKKPVRPRRPSPSGNGATLQHEKAEPDADREEKREEAWAECEPLARSPRILDQIAEDLRRGGLVGEERAAKLIYLVLVSRFLDRPLCAVVKGPSSAGKNHVTQHVLSLFPPSAAYRLTGMSERALAYGKEPLAHRILAIQEAAGLTGGVGAYLMRSLISEGRLRYETVESGPEGLKPRVIERAGPTGLLVTTTALNLDAELETRMFSIPITDSAEQTRSVLIAIGSQAIGAEQQEPMNLDAWHGLQMWLETGEHRVVVPYAENLATAIPPVAVRLRRDFSAVLRLIKAHAILRQYQRERDAQGRVVATIDDYAAVYELVADLVSAGVEASVPPTVRETVEAAKALKKEWADGVPQSAVKGYLQLDKSTVSRRVKHAIDLGYLVDQQEKRGQPALLQLGDPLPVEIEVLPRPEVFAQNRCGVAAFPEGEGAQEQSPSEARVAENGALAMPPG